MTTAFGASFCPGCGSQHLRLHVLGLPHGHCSIEQSMIFCKTVLLILPQNFRPSMSAIYSGALCLDVSLCVCIASPGLVCYHVVYNALGCNQLLLLCNILHLTLLCYRHCPSTYFLSVLLLTIACARAHIHYCAFASYWLHTQLHH